MKTFITFIFSLSSFLSLSQEMYDLFIPLMQITDSSVTVIPLSSSIDAKNDSIKHVEYYDENGQSTCSVGYYSNGKIHVYHSQLNGTPSGLYNLTRVKWERNNLVYYQIEGPGYYLKSWEKDSAQNTIITNLDTIGIGIQFTYNKEGNIIKKSNCSGGYKSTNEYDQFGHITKSYLECASGFLYGIYVEYDKQGNSTLRGNYSSEYVSCDEIRANLKHGEWKYFKAGNLYLTEIWENGELISSTEIDSESRFKIK